MAPLLLALLLLAQDGVPAPAPAPTDGPVATAVARKQDVAPLPIQGGPVAPPTDDYGYVGWCYGAVSGYVELYDRAMPEVIRIERAWPTPSTEENIKEVYPAQKREAVDSMGLFKRAIEAAEKASPTPIANQGAAAIKKGRAVWTGAGTVPKAQLAQFWMSWSPPSKCEETAKALEARSNLFGQALSFNAPSATPPAPVAAPEPGVDIAAIPPVGADRVVTSEPAAAEPAPDSADATADDAMPMDAVKDEAGTVVEGPVGPGEPAQASAIDDLVSTSTEPTETDPNVVTPDVVEPAKPAEPVAEPITTTTTTKPGAKPKPGLRDTLKGMRGRQ